MQTKKILMALALPALVLASCKTQQPNNEAIVGPVKPVVTDSTLTPEILWSFGRIGEFAVSPDGQKVAYTTAWYSIDQNRGNSEIYIMNTDGTGKRQLTHTNGSEFNLQWVDSLNLAYLATESGKSQIWQMNVENQKTSMVEGFENDISGFSISPTGSKILLTSDVKVGASIADIYPDLPKSSGQIYTTLMYRHWDTWEDSLFNHVMVANFDGKSLSKIIDIMANEPYDTPLKPFDGMEDIAWSPDGNQIAYTCKKLTGKEAAFSTNSDIYLYDLRNGKTQNLTEGLPGYDKQPVFSPDGEKIAWLSMERAGFEADKDRLLVMDLQTKKTSYLTRDFDYSVSNVIWNVSSDMVYFIAGVEATYQIYRLALQDAKPVAITHGWHDYHAFALAGDRLIGSKASIVKPVEIYSINPQNGEEVELSFTNQELLSQLKMPTVRQRWIKSTDGKLVHTWIILPPDFDSTKSYPALLYCEGGPQSAVSQFWSYRWNFSIMASGGYVVVAPSRRGTLTFGQKWTDEISKNHGGQDMKDLLSAIDEVKKEPWVDENRLGAVGASYGGYSVFWLAGNHNKRFKAFIAHCGVFHSEMEYLTTEEMFFDTWEMGGTPWEKNNPVAMNSYAQSPHNFITSWDTPILIISGGNDFRIPYTQGMAAFNAAQILGVPSKFIFFPDENHWVLKPQNGILWQREFRSWLDRWLK